MWVPLKLLSTNKRPLLESVLKLGSETTCLQNWHKSEGLVLILETWCGILVFQRAFFQLKYFAIHATQNKPFSKFAE